MSNHIGVSKAQPLPSVTLHKQDLKGSDGIFNITRCQEVIGGCFNDCIKQVEDAISRSEKPDGDSDKISIADLTKTVEDLQNQIKSKKSTLDPIIQKKKLFTTFLDDYLKYKEGVAQAFSNAQRYIQETTVKQQAIAASQEAAVPAPPVSEEAPAPQQPVVVSAVIMEPDAAVPAVIMERVAEQPAGQTVTIDASQAAAEPAPTVQSEEAPAAQPVEFDIFAEQLPAIQEEPTDQELAQSAVISDNQMHALKKAAYSSSYFVTFSEPDPAAFTQNSNIFLLHNEPQPPVASVAAEPVISSAADAGVPAATKQTEEPLEPSTALVAAEQPEANTSAAAPAEPEASQTDQHARAPSPIESESESAPDLNAESSESEADSEETPSTESFAAETTSTQDVAPDDIEIPADVLGELQRPQNYSSRIKGALAVGTAVTAAAAWVVTNGFEGLTQAVDGPAVLNRIRMAGNDLYNRLPNSEQIRTTGNDLYNRLPNGEQIRTTAEPLFQKVGDFYQPIQQQLHNVGYSFRDLVNVTRAKLPSVPELSMPDISKVPGRISELASQYYTDEEIASSGVTYKHVVLGAAVVSALVLGYFATKCLSKKSKK